MNATASETDVKFVPTAEILESLGFEDGQGFKTHYVLLKGKDETARVTAMEGNQFVTLRTFENGKYHDSTDSVLRVRSEQNLRDLLEMARPE